MADPLTPSEARELIRDGRTLMRVLYDEESDGCAAVVERLVLALEATLPRPIEEAPGEGGGEVLLVTPWHQYAVAHAVGDCWRYGPQNGDIWDGDYPTLWWPLPKTDEQP